MDKITIRLTSQMGLVFAAIRRLSKGQITPRAEAQCTLRWPKGTVRIRLGDKSAKSGATSFFDRFSGPY